jgi:hypothetical protein
LLDGESLQQAIPHRLRLSPCGERGCQFGLSTAPISSRTRSGLQRAGRQRVTGIAFARDRFVYSEATIVPTPEDAPFRFRRRSMPPRSWRRKPDSGLLPRFGFQAHLSFV